MFAAYTGVDVFSSNGIAWFLIAFFTLAVPMMCGVAIGRRRTRTALDAVPLISDVVLELPADARQELAEMLSRSVSENAK